MASKQTLYPTHNIDETSLICGMQLCVRSLANKMCNGYVNDIEDYVQAAYEDIIKAARRTGRTDTPYLYGVARIAMLQYKKQNEHAASLDAWMYDEDTGMHRDVEDKPEPHRQATRAQRMLVNKLLSCLSRRDESVVRAAFGIGDYDGRVITPEGIQKQWHITKNRFSGVRYDALHKMAVYASVMNLQPPSGGAA